MHDSPRPRGARTPPATPPLPAPILAAALAASVLAGCTELEDEPHAAPPAAGAADAARPDRVPAAAPTTAPFPDAGRDGPGAPPDDAAAGEGPVSGGAPGAAAGVPASPTDGAPGATDVPPPEPGPAAEIDCALALPCALRAPGGAHEVRLARAGGPGLGRADALVVDLTVEALARDATLGLDLASSAAWGGERTAATGARLGDGRAGEPDGRGASAVRDASAPDGAAPGDRAGGGAGDVARHPLRPGAAVGGALRFAGFRGAVPDALDRVELVVHEAGRASTLAFANVPLGPAAAPPVDCALSLPCAWTSPDGALSLEVDAVATDRWHHYTRTAVDWRLAATGPASAGPVGLELADTARARTDTGHDMEYYGIEFGGTTSRGEGPLGDSAAGGAAVPGRTVFRRAPPEGATSLATLEIVIAERAQAPARGWRVALRRLPVTR